MQVPVKNLAGEVVEQLEVADSIFGVPFNEAVVHQAMVRQLANARLGTADTKTRSEVVGSTRKLYRQKHTGWARRGSRRSPLLKGGGVVFGPRPRSYNQRMPKKMRRLALKCVLSAKAAAGELVVIEEFDNDKISTAKVASALKILGAERSALLVTAEPEQVLVRSARNLPRTKTLPANLLNVVDLLSYTYLVINKRGVQKVEQTWAGNAEAGRAN